VGRCGLGASGSGWGLVVGCSEHSNELSGFINGGSFIDYLSDYQLLEKDSAPWS
jgi:hypothetical protein